MPRERRLGDDLDPGDTEDRGRAVCPEHPYLVSQLYVLQVEEHRSPSVAVDVPVDERRPGLPRGDHMVEPAGQVEVAQGRDAYRTADLANADERASTPRPVRFWAEA